MGMNKVRQSRVRYRFEAEGGTAICSLALHNSRGDWL